MRIPLPLGIPFEIVGHRPGQLVDDVASNDTIASTLRNYLPIQLRRTARPAWADETPFWPSSAEAENFAAAQFETPAQRLSNDLRTINDWVNRGPRVERTERQEVARAFTQCLGNPNETELALRNLQHVTSLPPIPRTVTNLTVQDCNKLETPPILAEESQMKTLSFSGCRSMREAPDVSQCTGLKRLSLIRCDEITAPPDLSGCQRVTTLSFGSCPRLAALPELAGCPELIKIDICDCNAMTGSLNLSPCPQVEKVLLNCCSGINELEFSECHALRSIEASECASLQALSSVGHLQHLQRLSLRNTSFTSLPDGMLNLPQNCVVNFDERHLSAAERNHFADVMSAPGYAGPRFNIPLARPGHRTLDQEVAAWRAEAPAELRPALLGFAWSEVPAADYPEGFTTFLARVRETSDYKDAPPAVKSATQERVAKLLVQLQSDPALREQCFTIGLTAVNSCQDQIAMGFMEMEELAMARAVSAAIDAGTYDKNPQELGRLVDLVKGQHRMEIIKTAASKKVAELKLANPERFIDPLEIHLGYITKLKEDYGLPVQIKTMFFTRLSEVDANDLTAVRRKLSNTGLNESECKANNDAYQTSLAVSPLMRKWLLRARPDETTSANIEIEAEIDEKQNKIRDQLDALKADSADFDQQNLQLMAAYHAAPMTIPVQKTLSILLPFLRDKGIDSDLNDSVRRHDRQL